MVDGAVCLVLSGFKSEYFVGVFKEFTEGEGDASSSFSFKLGFLEQGRGFGVDFAAG